VVKIAKISYKEMMKNKKLDDFEDDGEEQETKRNFDFGGWNDGE